MAFKYQVGDILRSRSGRDGVVDSYRTRPSISGTRTIEEYVMIPSSGPYSGRKMYKSKATMEDGKTMTLVGGPSFVTQSVSPQRGRIQLPNIDIDENTKVKMAHDCEIFMTVTRKSPCDCGAHKCGYKDNELHAHARWCKLNELSQGAKDVG